MYDVMMYTPVFMMLEAASAHVPDIPATEAGLSSPRHHRGTSRGRQPRPMEARDPATAASADQWRGCWDDLIITRLVTIITIKMKKGVQNQISK